MERMIQPKVKDLGGFSVRRVLPAQGRRTVGPWIFFDHMGPVTFEPGQGLNVRPHPHINLATVTYLFEGEILHRDSLGNVQPIRPGEINLMVAGRGIVHSERERPEVRDVEHRAHGLQLWHALPEEAEEVEPSFHHHGAEDFPVTRVGGVPLRVLMGSAYGVTSPVATYSPIVYVEAELGAGQSLPLPDAEEVAVYTATGSLRADDQPVAAQTMAVFTDGGATLTATEDARIAIIGGAPLGRRYLDWNFASSRKERIEQARDDWREGRFPVVPGDEEEFIPLPE